VLKLNKGLIVFFLAFTGVCSVSAEEKDWNFWQERLSPFSQTEPSESVQSPVIKETHVTGTLPDYPWVKVSGYKNRPVERCLTCHDGIANVSPSHPPEFGCSVCHGGEPESIDKEQAHATLIYDPEAGTGKRNPSSLSVVEKSCGQLYCHSGHADEDRNHIKRVKKSMMNTMAGVISGLRYQWAGQSRKTARYGTLAISDEDGSVPHHQGALNKLDQVPYFSSSTIPESDLRVSLPVSRHPADRVLRKQCFQCHLDSPPAEGQYRSQGCSACHFEYSSSGLYEGKDPTISHSQPGHARFHKIRAIPSRSTCVKCHRSFEMQSLGSDTEQHKERNIEETIQPEESIDTVPPEPDITDTSTLQNEAPLLDTEALDPVPDQDANPSIADVEPLFAGRGQVKKDVHTERGMDCTDCHTQRDIMGDGNLYSKQHEAVEIRCETCHGDSRSYPYISQITDPEDSTIRVSKHYKNGPNNVGDWMAVSEHNRKMTNIKVQEGHMVAVGKQSGKIHEIPLVKDFLDAHSIPQHQSRLECSACHARWVVRCPGCHQSFTKDQSSLQAPHSLDIGEPALMIGPRGKVAPMLTQPKRQLTILDEKKNSIPVLGKMGEERGHYRQWSFTNPHGTSGANLAYALNPHSIQKQARSCTSCHLSSKSLGLGEGDLKIGKDSTGKNDFVEPVNRSDIMRKASQFEPQAKISMRGESLAGTHQPKARTFNQKEINRILRVGNCIPCHDNYGDPIYKDIKSSYQFANTQDHRQLREKILSLRQTTE
jgi:hypothetical protein